MAKAAKAKKTAAKKKATESPKPALIWTNGYTDENHVWLDLLTNGFKRVDVHFSGGNDEGGSDNIFLIAADDTATDIQNALYDNKNPNHKIAEALAEPVYSEYGSFAGEYYVNGTLTWDVASRKISIEGSCEVATSDPIDKTVSWRPPSWPASSH